jgi:hypothetical protein
MPYRDEAGSLEERHQHLRRALDENRQQSRALTEEEAALHRELAALHTKLSTVRSPKRQLPLANVLIASPCDVPWTSMVGDERRRHCGSCNKDVHNLSAMTRDEIDAFLDAAAASGPTPCVSLFQRADGTVLTADCPVGVRRRRMRSLLAVTLGAGAMAVIGFTALALLLHGSDSASVGVAERLVFVEPVPVPTVYSRPAEVARFGYVAVHAPAGTRVFEGDRLLGTAPFDLVADVGTHVYRLEHASSTQTTSAIVRDHETSHITFATPVPQTRRTAGVMRRPPDLDGLGTPKHRTSPADELKRARGALERANADTTGTL